MAVLDSWSIYKNLLTVHEFYYDSVDVARHILVGFCGFHGFRGTSIWEVSWKSDMGFQVPKFSGFLWFYSVSWVEQPLETKMLNYWCSSHVSAKLVWNHNMRVQSRLVELCKHARNEWSSLGGVTMVKSNHWVLWAAEQLSRPRRMIAFVAYSKGL